MNFDSKLNNIIYGTNGFVAMGNYWSYSAIGRGAWRRRGADPWTPPSCAERSGGIEGQRAAREIVFHPSLNQFAGLDDPRFLFV